MDEVVAVLKKLGIPYAYDHFAEGEGPDPPFICYLNPNSDNFAADGTVYFDVDEINIELYTDEKDPVLERKLQKLLKQAGIFYDKDETWIDSEKLYEVIYDFEVPAAEESSAPDDEGGANAHE